MRFSLGTGRMISAPLPVSKNHSRSLREQPQSVTERQTNRERLSLRILQTWNTESAKIQQHNGVADITIFRNNL